MTDKELQAKLSELTKTVDNLSIKQTKLEEQITNIGRTVREIKEILEPQPINKQQLIKGSTLEINNTVTILNLTRGQQSEGKIIGVTKDNLAEIKISNGSVIRRIIRNIKKL